MKIAIVSAHYPPNFVSGGTLVPQRLARGFAARGHDVAVFAGWLGDRPALETWTEYDEAIRIDWTVITPFIGWDDDANFRNPAVDKRFASWLDEMQPDVVHLHSLQSMGAGLVRVAKEHGARVVVTMHDFWWVCARQFLVDLDVEPCCPVVACAMCPCQTGYEAAEHRRVELRAALQSADIVLAPSRSAAAILRANGVDRVEVDENGIELPQRLARRGCDELVIRYCGGPNPMKGPVVLAEAMVHIEAEGEWSVVAHGIGPLLDERPELRHARLIAAEPYGPSELAALLAETAVVVLPSVMRESHSILTREALVAGVPVVTTDSVGPEEVVRNGVNGFVVPTNDARALGLALSRVLGDAVFREAVARAAAIDVVTPDEQVEANLARYVRVLEATSATRSNMRRVVFVVGIGGAPLRYRARLPGEALGLLGVSAEVFHYHDERWPTAAAQADAVVIYRVPATVEVLDTIDVLRREQPRVPIVFDVDDLIFDIPVALTLPHLAMATDEDRALYLDGIRRYRATLDACDVITSSTPAVVESASATLGKPGVVVPNGVGILLGRASDAAYQRPRTTGPFRLGYFSGTTTHDHDWHHIEPAVLAVMARHPEIELWLGGYLEPTAALELVADRVKRLPFTDWRALPGRLRDLDVNLAPLTPGSVFNEAKSAIKWLEAALVATPTVASPTAPFREAIDDGRTGLLAATVAEWEAALERLVSDELLRRAMGEAARRDALVRWSPYVQAGRELAALEAAVDNLAAWRAAARPREEAGTMPSEPFGEAPLEPYVGLGVVVRQPRPRQRVRPAGRSRLQLVVDRLNGAVPDNVVGRMVRRIGRTARKFR